MPTPPQDPSQQAAALAPDAELARGSKCPGLNDAPLGPKFSLRTLLIVTAGSAAVALLLGYGYRAAEPESGLVFLLFWGAILSMLMLYLGLHAFRSWQRRQIVGPIRFTLTRVNGPRPSFVTILVGWGLCMLALLAAYAFTSELIRNKKGADQDALPAGMALGLLGSAGLHLLYRPFTQAKPIRLGDRGLIVGDRPMPWTNVSSAAWNVLDPSQLQISTWHERPYIVEVPIELHEPLEAFVAERTHFASSQKN
jgi:hypothetical protein